jgi:hypothetical protein
LASKANRAGLLFGDLKQTIGGDFSVNKLQPFRREDFLGICFENTHALEDEVGSSRNFSLWSGNAGHAASR